MLVMSLVLSSALLAIGVYTSRKGDSGATALWSLGFLVHPAVFAGALAFPPVMLQSLLMLAAVGARRLAGSRPTSLARGILGAALAAYVAAGFFVLEDARRFARLRALHPYESMEARVPAPRPAEGEAPPGPDASARLARLEDEMRHGLGGYRDWQLRRLHEEKVGLFVNAPGFGVARMMTPSELNTGLRPRSAAPRQPGPLAPFDGSPGGLAAADAADVAPLGRLLDDSIVEFADERGFGYVKDRRHVSGFRPHGFSEVPEEKEDRWRVRSLELIGLLLRDEPAAYVSDVLPSMDRLRGAATRPLDRFEGPALEALRRGDDLFIARDGEAIRMLGAVRSGRRCVACHGGERGALLGAFSYVLGPAG